MKDAGSKKDDMELDMSPAETAQEMERLRKEIAELRAAKTPEASFTITAQSEIDAGTIEEEDDKGEKVTTQLWWYRIDLPPSGGTEIKINGHSFFHGEQYKIRTDTLRSLKDIVHRSWQHEANISGSNENFYRRPTERRIGGRK